jgi:PAS domain S-box-containing protein
MASDDDALADRIAREQRELITFVQQAARIAFWKYDLATGDITFDSGSCPVYGHPLSKITNRAEFRAIVHPDDRAQITANVQRATETGELVVSDFRVIDPQGEIIWLEARSQTAVVDGKPVTLGGMTIDITDRKRSEQALAASEERYRVLTELSPQFLWTGSPDGQITYANQGFLDYLGFTMEDIGSERWLTAFHPGDRDRVRDIWMRSVTTGETYEIEARLTEGHTGDARWWWIRALPLRDESGSIAYWLGVAVDIHDRKTAADELHQKQLETERQRAELETLYKTAPIGLALFDPVEFRYLRLNDRQAEIAGLPPSKILGRRLTEIAPIPGLDEMFQQVAAGTPIKDALIEGTVAARPEEHRFWNVNYFPVYNADGTVRAITAASLEITNQKRAENALLESEKLAAVGRLAASISHEINNPLEAVTNLLYIIAHDPSLSPELLPFVETAQSELQRVCQIATQTLRFHRQAVRATQVTADELVEAVLTLYQGRLVNSGIQVEARYDARTPILCFENDIRQVLNNLIANAIDAMRQGGRLVVRAHDTSHPCKGVRITIADTGHGMSAAVLARVFEPFYTTKDLNGTGLGLWISSGIIERHGGRIHVRSSESARHHGTVFTLFLPHGSEAEVKAAKPLQE